ncbi:DUF4433 domain-containing protein [Sorangium sp. So ce590]|uniref:type II toxin-antitoxin system toxin DNA ADP-ribosyl transferase DarT n=1 Tax=Sorangium sp. So ce590 TaxID=3133317 RepID=UPI003F5E4500
MTPKIYHITHVGNLASIVANGGLFSDAAMIARGGPSAGIGMSNIKRRRLRLPVVCHPPTYVGDYVPFYFCPRSIMLFVIHCGNHPDLGYRGGQGPIVHLEADLHEVIAWAEQNRRRWAFSLSNAGAVYTSFRADVARLDELDWQAIAATDFRNQAVKEAKQAEFLVHEWWPWTLVRSVGVQSSTLKVQVETLLATAVHRPTVAVQPHWYY